METFCAAGPFKCCRANRRGPDKRENDLSINAPRGPVRRSARTVLERSSGSFDLTSILVATVVVGVLTVGALAGLFGVIPFSQDTSAEQDLNAVVTAQRAVKGTGNPYLPMIGLINSEYLQDHPSIGVYTSEDSSCYVAVSKSATGAMFFVTSERPEPAELTRGTDTGCMPQQWIETILGPAQAATPSPGATTTAPTVSAAPAPEPSSNAPSAAATVTPEPTPTATPAPSVPAPATTPSPSATPSAAAPAATASATPVPSTGPSGTANCPGDQPGQNQGQYRDCSTVVPVPGRSVSSISATTNATCAVADGRGYCWGTGKSDVPREIDMSGALAGKTITSISASPNRTCATASGAVYCWGSAKKDIPVRSVLSGTIAGKSITNVATAPSRTCAIADGHPYCWGSGSNDTPVRVAASGPLGTKAATTISASNNSTCATTKDGTAYCWGAGADDQPQQVGVTGGPAGKAVTSISTSTTTDCLTAAGKAYCWTGGSAGAPQEFDASGALAGRNTTSISAATNRTCAIAERTAYCWGPGNFTWQWLFGGS